MNLSNTNLPLIQSQEKFKIISDFSPSGDQPVAIKTLVQNLKEINKSELHKLNIEVASDLQRRKTPINSIF